jgi:integrase
MASITKRGKYWRVQIKKKGYTTQYASFDTKAEAEVWAGKTTAEMQNRPAEHFDNIRLSESTTLRGAMDRYVAEIMPSKKESTRKRETAIAAWWQNSTYASTTLTRIDGPLASAAIKTLKSEGKSANTIRLHMALLSHLFTIARKEWGMTSLSNPVQLVRMPKLPEGRSRRLEEDQDEEERLIASCRKTSEELADIVIVAIETGMRQNEILKMQWSMINWLKHTITLPSEITKTDKGRVVPLSVRAEEALQRQQQRPSAAKATQKVAGQVWTYTADGMRASYNKARKRAGILGLTFHDLRHEALSKLAEAGLPITQLQAISGHKTAQMLARYSHIKGRVLVDAVRNIKKPGVADVTIKPGAQALTSDRPTTTIDTKQHAVTQTYKISDYSYTNRKMPVAFTCASTNALAPSVKKTKTD